MTTLRSLASSPTMTHISHTSMFSEQPFKLQLSQSNILSQTVEAETKEYHELEQDINKKLELVTSIAEAIPEMVMSLQQLSIISNSKQQEEDEMSRPSKKFGFRRRIAIQSSHDSCISSIDTKTLLSCLARLQSLLNDEASHVQLRTHKSISTSLSCMLEDRGGDCALTDICCLLNSILEGFEQGTPEVVRSIDVLAQDLGQLDFLLVQLHGEIEQLPQLCSPQVICHAMLCQTYRKLQELLTGVEWRLGNLNDSIPNYISQVALEPWEDQQQMVFLFKLASIGLDCALRKHQTLLRALLQHVQVYQRILVDKQQHQRMHLAEGPGDRGTGSSEYSSSTSQGRDKRVSMACGWPRHYFQQVCRRWGSSKAGAADICSKQLKKARKAGKENSRSTPVRTGSSIQALQFGERLDKQKGELDSQPYQSSREPTPSESADYPMQRSASNDPFLCGEQEPPQPSRTLNVLSSNEAANTNGLLRGLLDSRKQ